MKLVTYRFRNEVHIGCVVAGGIVDVGARLGFTSWRSLLSAGRIHDVLKIEGLDVDHAIDEVLLLPPVPDAAHFYCVGVNYLDHLSEVQKAGVERPKPKHPSLFVRFPETLVGHGSPIIVPRVSEQLDYEAELAVIIGRAGRYIPKEEALSYVAGYSCFNDGSIRDWQFHSSQVTSGKNFVGTGGFGPWIVTPDELPDASQLDVKLLLNGRLLQSSNTRELIFDLPTIISYASALVPLQPGDVIATGTPAGVGFSRNPPLFMKPDDVCEVHIEAIGTLRNPIAQEAHRGARVLP